MTLKDWKKANGENTWRKKNDTLTLIKNYTKSPPTYQIEIFLWETPTRNAKNILKSFKTKSSALKFAKAYMKNN